MLCKIFSDIYTYWSACRLYSIIVGILTVVCVYKINKNRTVRNILVRRAASAGLFGGYLVCFLYITLFMRFVGYRREVDLIPFHFIVNYQIELVLFVENIVLFIPMGLYMRSVMKKSKETICFGVAISVAIELLQFIFCCGKTEIDDVIANTLGAWIGIISYNMLCKFRKMMH